MEMKNNSLEKEVDETPTRPCLVPCITDSGYDPCGSCEDINEKDLAVILKEETAKLEKLKNSDVNKQRKAAATKIEVEETEILSDIDISTEGASGGGASGGGASGGGGYGRGSNSSAEKKQGYRKVIKNPFFKNRLQFSSNSPPPPPNPPPQFLPLVEESDSIKRANCPKKKKKCKKKQDLDGNGSKGKDKTDGTDGKGKKNRIKNVMDGIDGSYWFDIKYGRETKDGKEGSEDDEEEEHVEKKEKVQKETRFHHDVAERW